MFNRKNGSRKLFGRKSKKQSSKVNEFADFYNGFASSNKDSAKKNGKKEDFRNKIDSEYNQMVPYEEENVQEEQVDYDYNENNNYSEVDYEERKKKRKKILLIVGIVLFLAIIGLIIIVLIKSPKIRLNEKEMTLNVGESKYVSFEIINTENSIATTFSSEDIAVATIDENGNVSAVGPGVTNIIISYNINNIKRKEKCKVTVLGEEEKDIEKKEEEKKEEEKKEEPKPTTIPKPVTTPAACTKDPNLSLSITNAQENVWTNKDVIINISSSSNCGGSISLKYGINCKSSSCSYTSISGNSITITKTGTNTIVIVAVDSANNKEASSSVTLKIDKTPPTLTLLPDGRTTFSPKSSNTRIVQICASCTDNESGCKVNKVCDNFSTGTTGTLTASDNVGNNGSSKTFTINAR